MIAVSNDFKTAMTQPVKELQAYIGDIKSEDDLISFKINSESGMCKTAMRKLEAKYTGNHNLLGQWVHVGFGVKLADGTFEYLDYGSFLVSEITTAKDTEITTITGYDKMINAMTPYVKLDVEYPMRLIDYTKLLCNACNLELSKNIFGENRVPSFDSGKWVLSNGAFINEDGNLEFPNDNSKAVIEINWDTNIETISVQYTIVTGGNCHLSLTYLDENRQILDTNGRADKDKEDNYLVTASFGGDNVYGEAISKAKYVRLTFQTSTNAPNPYVIKNISCDTYIDKFKDCYTRYNPMNDWLINGELWENINGITYRDIFVQIAQATGTVCIIGADDKVYFKPLTETGEELTYNNMFKLSLEPKYGEINSVVLARTPQEDNIYMRDEASIRDNGLTEFKIENNEIIDKDRDNAMTPIYNALKGISYYPFESSTEGLGWYEIGDKITIINDTGDLFETAIFNINIDIDGSIKETLKTVAETKTQTQYQYATTIAKRVKNTEIIVNKQDEYIKSLVSDMYDENGVINNKFTEIYQNLTEIIQSVQNSGGSNLLKNSVMFAYENDNVNDWELSETGEIVISSNAESLNAGCLSGHGFSLLNKTASQKILVNSDNKYSFSTKIKKGLDGSCYVKIYNSNEEYLIEVIEGEEVFYKEYEIKDLSPKDNYYIVEFYGSADSNATFTDNMFSIGEYKSQWTQANGEIMNTQVNVNVNGVLVKSSVYLGDYTVMSPLEFAGYSNINGTITKVFSLNKDITYTKKLEAEDEINMTPIKIVPVKTGDLIGWAFVPSTKNEEV